MAILHYVVWFSALLSVCNAVRVRPCRNNKIAPYPAPEGKTFNYLFGSRPFGSPQYYGDGCGPQSAGPQDNPALATVDGDNSGSNYVGEDPVEEDTINNNDNFGERPVMRPSPGNRPGFGGFLDWFGEDTQGWPTRPPRPQRPQRPPPPFRPPSWFSDWFDGGYRPPRPTRPTYDDNTKPVHEHIENDENEVTWKPGAVVGGPNNNIVAHNQDFSSWSTPPTPRPTRPSIPGYNRNRKSGGGSGNGYQGGIIGSFVDLIFNK